MRLTAALLVLFLGGCHYYFEDDDGPSASSDASWGGGSGDGGGGPTQDAQPADGCDAAALLPNGFVPVESVSAGEVTSAEDSPGVFTTEIDATAGGPDAQTTSPFIYLDLLAEGGAVKVDLDDVAAFESTEWDLALKRYVVRTNGGDSGPGDDGVASIDSPELTFTTEAPETSPDDWTSNDCEVILDGVAGPRTGFSDWYYVQNGRFLPRTVVHVVRLRDGSHAEIDIDTYYADGGNPNRGGVYRLLWRRF